MKFFVWLALLQFSVGASSFAGERRSRTSMAAVMSRSFSEIPLSFSLTQVLFDATSDNVNTHLRAMLKGIHLGYTYNRPLKSIRWVSSYGVEAATGWLTGQADLTEDQVKQQSWMAFGFIPGIFYRSSTQSRVGVIAPLTFRTVNWKVDEVFKVKEDKFSVGVGLHFLQHIDGYSAFTFSVVRQHQWDTTEWRAGYVYKL